MKAYKNRNSQILEVDCNLIINPLGKSLSNIQAEWVCFKAENQEDLLSQFPFLAEVFIGNVPVKYLDTRVLRLVNFKNLTRVVMGNVSKG